MAGKNHRSAKATSNKYTNTGPYPSIQEAAIYRILVAGRLDASWSERTGGMTLVVHDESGGKATSELSGPLQDQAALMGVLDQFYVLGVHVLKVERLGAMSSARDDTSRSGRHQQEPNIKLNKPKRQ